MPKVTHETGRSLDLDLVLGGGLPPAGVPSAQDPRPGGSAVTLSIRSCLLSPFPSSSMMCQLSVVESKSATFPSEKARHLLDDSVLESRSPRRGLALTSSSAITNGLSLGKRLQPARHRGATARCVLCLSVTVQRLVAPHPCSKGSLQESPEPGRPLRPGLQGFTKCPRLVLILPMALSLSGRWKEQPEAHLRPAIS